MDTLSTLHDEKCACLQSVYNRHSQHSYFTVRICIIRLKYGVTAISDDRSISAILINKYMKTILQVTKGTACCLVQKQTF